jgi:site-specific DNA-methyltransferase (cytosine-N4-specific)
LKVSSNSDAHLEPAVGAAELAYQTGRGAMWCGDSKTSLSGVLGDQLRGKVQLIFTSPPFSLNCKKRYGNLTGEAYVDWFVELAPLFRRLLKPDGSIVIELGNAWEPGKPVMSPLALRALLAFLDKGKFNLCQQFICYNPARLPTPAQWVNVDRIRVKDAYTHVWWMSPSERPDADNRRVLKKYSDSMQKLLRRNRYNSGTRPSGHRVGPTSFLKQNGGAIPSNVITLANTHSATEYQKYCRARSLTPHPARMPMGLPEFFIKFLTTPRELVLDPFAGSNTTGAAAEALKRRWLSIEAQMDYIEGSRGRFPTLQPKQEGIMTTSRAVSIDPFRS